MVFMSAGIWAVSHGAETREDIRQELNITAAQYEKNSAYRDIWDDMQKRVSPFLISYVIINSLSLSLHVLHSPIYLFPSISFFNPLSHHQFQCCGVEGASDWRYHLRASQHTYPHSCCTEDISVDQDCPLQQFNTEV